ncbi:MAG: ABC transporter permease, partial [Candidatus Hadarchaeia archaeon]
MSPGFDRADIVRSKNSFFGDTWANCKRWLLKFINSPPLLVMNLVQPVIFLFMFTEVFGQVATGAISGVLGGSVNYVTYLLPAIAIQVSMATAQGAGGGLVRDMDEWIFEKVMVYPMSKTAVFLGKTLSEILRIVVQTGIILGLGVVLGAEIVTGFL